MFPAQGDSTSSGGNPFTAKFNTIGRSNPFSSVKGGSPSRNNPFLDTNGSSCDNGDNNHVTIQTNSPDASIDPTPILQPAILKHKQNQNGYDLVDSRRNGVDQSGSKTNKSVSTGGYAYEWISTPTKDFMSTVMCFMYICILISWHS